MRRTVALTILIALSALSALAAAVPARAQPDDGQLQAARSRLEQLDARLDDALAAVDAADARVSAAQTKLTAVRHDLVEAKQVVAARKAEEAAARQNADAATRKAERIADVLARVQTQLEDRVADAYIHGSTDTSRLLLRGITQAEGTHNVAVAVKTVENILGKDTDLVAKAQELATAADRARREAEAAHARAAAATDEAQQHQAEVDALVQQRQQILDQIEAARAEAASVARDIAADKAAQERLVGRLQQALSGLGSVLRTPEPDAPLDGAAPAWSALLPEGGARWAPALVGAARRAGMEPRLLAALVWTESRFESTAVSPVGAIGLTQLMPGTARQLGVDPHDPVQNLLGGARYVRAQIADFGDARLGLAAYNAGPGRVEAAGGVPEIVETQLYVLRIVQRFRRLSG